MDRKWCGPSWCDLVCWARCPAQEAIQRSDERFAVTGKSPIVIWIVPTIQIASVCAACQHQEGKNVT